MALRQCGDVIGMRWCNPADSGYNLRPRRHGRTLIDKTTDLNARNFLLRMLYKDCY